MSPEQKFEIQKIIVAELAAKAQEQPNLLIDVLLSGQGYQFVYQVLAMANTKARAVVDGTDHLMVALRGRSVDEDAA